MFLKPLAFKARVVQFVLLGEVNFSSEGWIRRLFGQILCYEAYFPLAPLLSECILGAPGQKFPYVVNHAIEQPLYVDLDLPS